MRSGKKINRDGKDGFTMVELCISLCIMSVGILAVAVLQNSSTTNSNMGNYITHACTIGTSRIDELKVFGDTADPDVGLALLDAENGVVVDQDGFTCTTVVDRPLAMPTNARRVEITVTKQGKGGWLGRRGLVFETVIQGVGQI